MSVAFCVPKPCSNCPFLKKGGIRLRAGRVREIAEPMLDSQGATFACHKTTRTGGGRGQDLHCAGAIIFAEKHDNATQMMRIAGRVGMYDPEAMMADPVVVAAVFDSIGEMEATALDAPRRREAKRGRVHSTGGSRRDRATRARG